MIAKNGRNGVMPALGAVKNPKKGLEIAQGLLSSGNTRKIEIGFRLIETIRERGAYTILMDSMENPDLAPRASVALAYIRDSRSLFPLINYFNNSEDPTVRQRILQYMRFTQDPRSVEFLEEYLQRDVVWYKEIAEEALTRCRTNSNFMYRYGGSDENLEKALATKGQIAVRSKELNAAKPILDDDLLRDRPQTYIISKDGEMLIGGYIQEHYQVAHGQDVKGAGQIVLGRAPNVWGVEYIDFRSMGYLPAATSFRWVQDFFARSDVTFDKKQFDKGCREGGYNDPDFLSVFRFGTHYR